MFGFSEQGKNFNYRTAVKSSIQAFCPVPETLPKCFPSYCNGGIDSDGFPKNDQSTTVKICHLPPPWSPAQPACWHHQRCPTSPPWPQENHPAHSKLKPLLQLYSKCHLGNTQNFPSCQHTAAPQQFNSQDAGMGRTPCQLHQHLTQKASCGHTHCGPHRQKGLVTAPHKEESKQQVKAGNLSEQQLLKLPASQKVKKSFNMPKRCRHLLPLNFFNIWEWGWSQQYKFSLPPSLPLQITAGKKNPM